MRSSIRYREIAKRARYGLIPHKRAIAIFELRLRSDEAYRTVTPASNALEESTLDRIGIRRTAPRMCEQMAICIECHLD